MGYNILLGKEASKYLDRMPAPLCTRTIKALDKLEEDPHIGKPLSGDLKGLYSLRIGGLRAIYSVEGKDVVVHSIAPRGQVYK